MQCDYCSLKRKFGHGCAHIQNNVESCRKKWPSIDFSSTTFRRNQSCGHLDLHLLFLEIGDGIFLLVKPSNLW